MTSTEVTAELDRRFGAPDAEPTPWADVRARLEKTELFWISTVRSDGRPHVTPLLAVWRDEAIYFCTGAGEQKGVNLLRANTHCALTTGNNEWNSGLDVVVEGVATRVTDDARLAVLAEAWDAKYEGNWHYEVHDGAFHHDSGEALVFEVTPAKVLAFAKGNFAQTRYTFSS